MTKSFFWSVVIVDSVVVLIGILQNALWLLNTQIALVCSMMITLSSFLAYKAMIKHRVQEGDVGDDRELLDVIEDPHGLYDDEEVAKLSTIETVKKSTRNVLRSYKGALSPYRLASYAFLCISVLFLIRHTSFNALAFLVGLSIVPLSSLLGVWFINYHKELP
ncbi:MAG: hypothetical protein PHR87_06690 [Sulfurospirillaceae bacterium]|nr:hypothetical protein [Sulfurospirillaceae bacterium]